jgi:hypothetical protein
MLAFWLAAAGADATEQARLRWTSYEDAGMLFELHAVMPAVIYVIGRAAGTGNVEAWLDAAFGASVDDPQVIASARAEAARWRGDAAAAKRWDDRLAAMRALVKDDRSAYLLRGALRP